MKALDYYLDYEQPNKYIVNDDNYSADYTVPVLTAGKSFVLGYTNEKENIFDASKEPVIIFDDFTTAIKYVDFPFKVKSSALKILHAKNGVNIKFIYYAMLGMSIETSLHKRYWISEFSKKEIKEYDTVFQNRIVNELDKIVLSIKKCEESIVGLEEIVNSRMNSIIQSNCKYKKLKELTNMERGSSITKNEAKEGEVPVIAGGQQPAYYHNKSNRVGETITISGSGAYAGYVQFWNIPIFCSDCFSIKSKDENVLKTSFLFYYLKCIQEEIYLTKRGAGIPHVKISSIENFDIPIVDMHIQNDFTNLVHKIEKATEVLKSNIKLLNDLFEKKHYEYFEKE